MYKAPVYKARNELNIYWEYILKDLGKMRLGKKLDSHVRKFFSIDEEETYWIDQHFLLPHFNRKVPDKTQGWYALIYFIIPPVLCLIATLYLMYKCVRR